MLLERTRKLERVRIVGYNLDAIMMNDGFENPYEGEIEFEKLAKDDPDFAKV